MFVPAARPEALPRRRTVRLILNPVAAAGRAVRGRVAEAFGARFGSEGRCDTTLWSGHARHLARRAALENADLVVAAGGDGTIHQVVNGLLDGAIGRRAHRVLGVIDCGTGSGFAESLGLPRAHAAQVGLIASPRARSRTVDLGRLACASVEGRAVCRAFVSECQVGIGAAVSAGLGSGARRLGGRLGYALTALREGLRHRAADVEIAIDDRPPVTRRLLGVVVANGARCGGGMRLLPHASLDDGLLDVLLIHDMSWGRRIGFLRRVFSGTHVDGTCCTATRARRVRVHAPDGGLAVSADGEVLGVTPLDVEVMPRAIAVLCPEGSAR